MIATRRPKTRTRTSETHATQMLVQNALRIGWNETLMTETSKKTLTTPPPSSLLAKTKKIRKATIKTAAAQPMQMKASSRPLAATRRAATRSSLPRRAARSLAFPKARKAKIHGYRLRTTSTTPTIVETDSVVVVVAHHHRGLHHQQAWRGSR